MESIKTAWRGGFTQHHFLSDLKSGAGFTLIEVLLVIAIIAILSSLVLGTVTASRNKAQDTRIKTSIRQLRVIAEDYYDGNNLSYEGFETCVNIPIPGNCLDQPTADAVLTLKTEIETANEQAGSIDVGIDTENSQYCLSAPLKSEPATWVCVESTGEIRSQGSAASPCATAGENVGICNFT